jgi:hypothetical protein
MKRPTKEIEQLRKALKPGAIDPKRVYRMDLGNGNIMQWTGAELLASATAFIQLADCEKKGDPEGMRRALEKIELDAKLDRDALREHIGSDDYSV